jgi:GntR family transcriptional regulator, carbon starvation induced regulator
MKKPRFDPQLRPDGETFASVAYARLRGEIISGIFAGGEKLRIRQLCERYGFGISPVREALNRLSSDGFVVQSDLQGFRVATLSMEDLQELTRTRAWLNERALRESIARGDTAWEESVVIAHHRLSRTNRWLGAEASDGVNPEWETAHRAFHTSLIAGCQSRWLIGYCEQLFDMADRYRYMSRTAAARRSRGPDEHRLIMEATIARDADLAVARLIEHFQKTAEHCLAAFASVPQKTSAAARRGRKSA